MRKEIIIRKSFYTVFHIYRLQENSNCTNSMYKNINSKHIFVFRKAGEAVASVRYEYIDDFRVHMSSFSLQQKIDIVELWRVRIQFVNQFTMNF